MVKTRMQDILEKMISPPEVSSQSLKAVSPQRRTLLEAEIEQGLYRTGMASGPSPTNLNKGPTAAGNVLPSLKKIATTSSSGSGGGDWRGSGGTVRQSPNVYSPLLLNSNLSLPRDRATVNAWCRSYFTLNPMVKNAILLHSTYPISKLSIKCKDKRIEKFFNNMIEEIDLMNVCVQLAQEYWTLGEAIVYADLDERTAKWSRLLIQNPDYIHIKPSVVANEPIISLRPDENLKKIIKSNHPADIQQRQLLPKKIIEHVKKGENIPLHNFYVSHLANKIAPYETRGTGLIVSAFKALMLFDRLREAKYSQADNMVNPLTLVKVGDANYKPTPEDLEGWRQVFECHDEETEVLTDQGFKKFNEVIEYAEVMDGTYNSPYISYAQPKSGVKIACFNPDTEMLEYHEPSKASLNYYSGEMYHYFNEKIDVKVTPNHDLWVSQKEYEYNGHRSLRKEKWGEWKKVKAENLKIVNGLNRFRSEVKWEGTEIKSVTVAGKEIPIENYLEFLGYVLSEGCLYSDGKYQHTVGICQAKYVEKMQKCADEFADNLNKSYSSTIRERKENRKDLWNGIISGKEIFEHFKNSIQDENGKYKAQNKRVPRWILDLSPRLLKIFLNALVAGDGSVLGRQDPNKNAFSYYSTSKQLADDVYEISFKCGYVPTVFVKDSEERRSINKKPLFVVMWSDCDKGRFPQVYHHSRSSTTKEKKETFKIEQYNGLVWCFTVPTGLFVTRRNGKVTIQGNSGQYDPDFKIFCHQAVTVERVGHNSGILDISPDITQLIKEVYIGLLVPSVLMDGGADTTYANGGVALDILRQRYMQFRNMLTTWLRRKIFAPISKLNEFYEWVDGEKVLIVPDVDWNHMSLFDAGDYIQTLTTLIQGDTKRVSLQTAYRSLGLDYEDEIRKMRGEQIKEAILEKEKQALTQSSLNELRALKPEDEIQEKAHGPLPGEDVEDMGEGMGLPGGPTMPAPPGPPSPPGPPPQ